MKIIITISFIILFYCINLTKGQYFVNFEDATKTSYTSGNVTLNGISWNLDQALIGTDANDMKFDLKAARLRYDGTTYGSLTMLSDKSNGIGNISFYYARSNFTGDRTGNAPSFVVEYSTNGGASWTQAGSTTSLNGIDNLTLFNVTVNVTGSARIRIRQVGGDANKRWNVDNITITDYTGCMPPITQAHSITFTNVQTNQMTINWSNGNGVGCLVKINTSNSFTNPVNGTTYTANSVYNGTGEQVIYVGSGNSVTVTNLNPITAYWFRIYEYNCSGTSITYNTNTATDNPNNQSTLPPQPTLTANNDVIWGMNYIVESGPSASQSYLIQGSFLVPTSGIIEVTAPLNYEISIDNINFSSILIISYSGGVLIPTNIYVRLKSGLPQGSYNGEMIYHNGGGANLYVSCSGTVFGNSTTPTIFEPGDIVVVALNSNIVCLPGYSSGDDEISFFSFKDIYPGTKFYITDNGYQRLYANQWGDTEGLYEIQRTGATIPAGTVITFRLLDANPFVQYIYPDANWTMTKVPSFTGNLIMNSNGDQIFFFQDGVWSNPAGSHNAVYQDGTFLFAFNTNNSWTSFANSTQQSGLPPGMECFQLMPGVATDFLKYTGPLTPTTKRGWIDRINDFSNWTNIPGNNTTEKCQNYYTTLPQYHLGQFMTITSGGFTAGIWTGELSSDWFNCNNWHDFRVPNENTNVFIPATGVTHNPTISEPPITPIPYTTALCKNLTVASNRTLTLNHLNSRLTIYGNIQIEGTISHTNGWIEITDNNSQIYASNPIEFHQLKINKNNSSNVLILNQDIKVNGTLSLTKGLINTQNYRIHILNPSPTAIESYSENSYILGNLRRHVSQIDSYDFPIGTLSHYELATIKLNSSSLLQYIDGSFNHPHTTSINIISLNLTINGTLLEELLDYGFWSFSPNGGTYNYDITLTSRGHTNPGPTAFAHAIVKRTNALSNWTSEGLHINSDQAMGPGWVRVTRRNLTTFSDFAIAKSNLGPLPVELLSFDAIRSNNNAFITWTTASEVNNNYFILERSIWPDKDFEQISIIRGAGNSNYFNYYQFLDENIPEFTLFYKLRQYDIDGKEKIFGPISLPFINSQNTLSVVQKYIDDGQVSLTIANLINGLLKIQLFDIKGRLIFNFEKEIDSEQTNIKIPLKTTGIYYIRVINNHQQLVTPLIIP